MPVYVTPSKAENVNPTPASRQLERAVMEDCRGVTGVMVNVALNDRYRFIRGSGILDAAVLEYVVFIGIMQRCMHSLAQSCGASIDAEESVKTS